MKRWLPLLLLPVMQAAAATDTTTVVLLHGLIRSSSSIEAMAEALAAEHVLPAIKTCVAGNESAGGQLGTVNGLPTRLGPTDLGVGIIAGNHTINPLLSLLIPGDDVITQTLQFQQSGRFTH